MENRISWRRLRREVSHCLHLTRHREIAILRQWLRGSPGQLLLDLGCGDGYWTSRLTGVARNCVGIDIGEDAIWRARSFYASEHLRFVQGRAEALPFPDHTFDRALCLCSLQNFVDPVAALHELGRVMIPGGLLALSVDSLLAPRWVDKEYRQYHASRFRTGRVFDLDVLSNDLRSAGFQVQEHRWLLRSRVAAFWSRQQERLGWSVNWWFPLSLPVAWLADYLTTPDQPGLILVVLARRPNP